MLDGSYNSHFRTIKNGLENKMTCGSDSYSKTKDKTVGILNNYHMGKQHTQVTPVKEEVTFA